MNLAIAVVPAVVQQGKFRISPNVRPSLLAGERCHGNYFNVASQNDDLAEAAGGVARGGRRAALLVGDGLPVAIPATPALEVIGEPRGQQGFAGAPRRREVGRFLAWLGRRRCLSKDRDRRVTSSLARLRLAVVRIPVRRLGLEETP